MSKNHFDLIVIGTGPSASTVAKKSRANGKRVAVIEEREFGGTCALRGCNPKKVYVNAADLVDRVVGGRGKLVDYEQIRIDWQQLLQFKKSFTDPVVEKSEASYQEKGIETFSGTASFTSPDAIRVGDHTLTSERFFIGAGARPRTLGIPGEAHVLQSDDFLELSEIPKRVVFIGGGYISMEFACVVARYGAQVTVLQHGDQILSSFDPDLVSQLSSYCAEHGIDIHTQCEVTGIEQRRDVPLIVNYKKTDQTDSVDADLVIHGAGRVPNIDRLDLHTGEVQFGEKGIKVDGFLRSVTNPRVFAAGDCADTGKPRLTPTANEEARVAVKNLFASQSMEQPNYDVIPRVAFTVPSIASVGMSEADARQCHEVDVHHEDTSTWGSVRKSGQRCAGYKILIDKKTDLILGAHLLGPAAEETINLFAMAMKFGLTASDVKSTLFVFPTFASDVRKMV
ncbi:regulatory protein [Rhodopirellula maiorica SM1]|uniref:Regulatory protein n=1 Tax=Rhodopirellula maiorica SM1 TaxID=1265738 RepID=M5RX66_9BACT|nr:NAD(P)/FAD-dependent oxidoreductase [Rhodopirellula maiorica]EMI18539.1 regulatory protein [Rhodopirellula maiorica SM1]